MIRRLLNILYGNTPAAFESSFGLEESVRRLQAAAKRSPTSQQAVGRVREDKVVLQRSIPFVSNSFKPFFIGRFKHTRSGVRLQGRFTMNWFVKAFVTFWFGFCAFWIAMATYAVVTSDSSEQWWLPLAGVAIFAAGLGVVKVGTFFARSDIAWLTAVIEAALSTEVRPNNSFKPKPLRGSA